MADDTTVECMKKRREAMVFLSEDRHEKGNLTLADTYAVVTLNHGILARMLIDLAKAIEGRAQGVAPDLEAKIKQLEQDAVAFGKNVMFHRCTNGSARPYHAGLCSSCMGKGVSFTALERVRELEKCLRHFVLLRTADLIALENGRHGLGGQTVVQQRLTEIRREVERVLVGEGKGVDVLGKTDTEGCSGCLGQTVAHTCGKEPDAERAKMRPEDRDEETAYEVNAAIDRDRKEVLAAMLAAKDESVKLAKLSVDAFIKQNLRLSDELKTNADLANRLGEAIDIVIRNIKAGSVSVSWIKGCLEKAVETKEETDTERDTL